MTITRRTLLAGGAAGALAASLLPGAAFAVPPNEDGYDLWLRYRLVDDSALLSRYRVAFTHVVALGNHAVPAGALTYPVTG